MMVGNDDDNERWATGDDGEEHKQCPNEVTVFNSVKRRDIGDDDVPMIFNEFKRSESFNNRSFESNIDT